MKVFKKYFSILKKTKNVYEKRFIDFGPNPRGVFWQNINTQSTRFETLIKAIDDNDINGGIKIADFGCGYGAFYQFISLKKFMTDTYYVGYDISPSMIREAKNKMPNINFVCSDKILENVDYVFISGTFNMAFDYSAKTWENYIFNQLNDCFSKTKKVLAFNLLFSETTKIENQLFYSDAKNIESYCNENLGPCLIVKTPKLKNDITVFVRKS